MERINMNEIYRTDYILSIIMIGTTVDEHLHSEHLVTN